MVDVVSPRAVTVNATFHHSLRNGESSSLTLPTICVHMWSVLRVGSHSAYGNAGQISSLSARGLDINSGPSAPIAQAACGRAGSALAAGARPDTRARSFRATLVPQVYQGV